MDTHNPQTLVIAAIVVVGVIALVWFIGREQKRKRSQRLHQRFGPEYERLVATHHGDRPKAEAELTARERRVERLKIVPLSPQDAAKFSQAWGLLQSRFVDNPKGVVVEADRLVRELMVKRGYPMANFEHRAADISVDHPHVVENYRAAQAIAVRDQRGEASTEELRKAVVYYRDLFDELLEVRRSKPNAIPEGNAMVQS